MDKRIPARTRMHPFLERIRERRFWEPEKETIEALVDEGVNILLEEKEGTDAYETMRHMVIWLTELKVRHELEGGQKVKANIVGWIAERLGIRWKYKTPDDVGSRMLVNFLWKQDEGWKEAHTLFFRMKPGNLVDRLLSRGNFSGVTISHVVFVASEKWYKVQGGTDSTFVKHEMVHHAQCERQVFPLLQFFLYGLESVLIYLFRWNDHPYYDNKYEYEAREKAGQKHKNWKEEGWNRWLPCILGGKR